LGTFFKSDERSGVVSKILPSNFVECIGSRKKFSSRYIFLLQRVISWRCTKQTIEGMSTMKVLLIACYEFSTHAFWLRHFKGFKIVDFIAKPIKIFYDNSTTYFFFQE
jgi:hypothetical protein